MLELLAGDRQNSESNKAVQACNDWLRLGPGRTLPALLEKYAKCDQIQPPTQSEGTLKRWSTTFDWLDRATAYDATWEQRKNEEREAELDHGLALDYERIRKLKRLADFLEDQLYEQGEGGVYYNVWVPDVKQIGSGDDAEKVDIERFNGSLIQQYRDVLDDIAKEVGERVKKVDSRVTGSGEGGAVKIQVVYETAPIPDGGDE